MLKKPILKGGIFHLLITLLLCFDFAHAAPVQWISNGNYYEYIDSYQISWTEARNLANSSSYNGVIGHLATITSSSENSFIINSFYRGGNTWAWICGWEPNNDGRWEWADGPESGFQFSDYAGPTAPYNYANWAIAEPNNATGHEDYASINIGDLFGGFILTGEWGDNENAPVAWSPVNGYIIEYETGNSVVPEPATMLLLGSGLVGLAGFRKRFKRR